MDLVAALALLAFIVGAVFGFIRKDFPVAFVATGLAILTLADVGLKI